LDIITGITWNYNRTAALAEDIIMSMQETKWKNLSELISHIEQSHHVYTREALAHIGVLFARENDSVAMTADVRRCFEALEADLMPHLIKEERILFPYIVALESGQSPASCFGSVANPVRMMEMEHQAVKKLLEQLRQLTANYRPAPEDNSNISALYAALAALDSDLVEHIHLEGDVLFPQALELEKNTSV
jgi:regulator of cell morphogenesis and NO signaling